MPYREPDRPKPTPEELDAAASELTLVAELKKRRRRLTLGILAGGLCLIGAFFGPAIFAGISASRAIEDVPLDPAIARDVDDRLGRISAAVQKSQPAFEALWPQLHDGTIGMRKDLGKCPATMPDPSVLEDRDIVLLDPMHVDAPASRWLYVDLAPHAMLRDTMRARIVGTSIDRPTITRVPRVSPGERAPVLDSTKDADRANELRLEAARLIQRDHQASFIARVNRFVGEALPLDVIVILDAWQDAIVAMPNDDGITRASTTTGYAIARAFAWSAAEARIVCATQAIAHHAPPGMPVPAAGSVGEYTLLLENLEKDLAASWSVSSVNPPKIERPSSR